MEARPGEAAPPEAPKQEQPAGKEDQPPPADKEAAADKEEEVAGKKQEEEEQVKASGWTEAKVRVRWRSFPEPGRIDEPLRIAMSKEATAEVAAHGREWLDKEVCGVLVGEVCEDDEGTWVSVKAAIRGTEGKRKGIHVTFDHDTWEAIYKIKDKEYKNLQVVGWYHTHPGFGVEFSAMDLFIQQNFFSGANQFALVLDPLGSDEALCVNTSEGVQYVGAYWVGGRKRTCRKPRKAPRADDQEPAGDEEAEEESAEVVSPKVEKRLKALEDRLQQLTVAIEEDQAARYYSRLWMFMFLIVAVLLGGGYYLYLQANAPVMLKQTVGIGLTTPPMRVRLPNGQEAAIVVPIGDGLVTWEVPPGYLQAIQDYERQKLEQKMKELSGETEQEPGKGQGVGQGEAKAPPPAAGQAGAGTKPAAAHKPASKPPAGSGAKPATAPAKPPAAPAKPKAGTPASPK